ncbi:MAG: TIGR01906 family membrane protein [Chloroflexi bacterium]|nr:TIGR01906 family membrane protein [Chloroflexota bacterium]
MRLLVSLSTVLFVVAIPLAIISTNVLWLALTPSFYENGQMKRGAMQTIGLRAEQVQASSRALSSYFGSDNDLASELQKQGLPASFFNERETNHLKDVKDLLIRVLRVQQIALGYGIIFLLVTLVLGLRNFLRRVSRGLLLGAGLTVVVLIVFGALSFADFSDLFLMFHLVSFTNDLWMLDPRTDYLIRMFPSQFFFEAALTLAAYALIESIGLALVGAGLLVVQRRFATQRAN